MRFTVASRSWEWPNAEHPPYKAAKLIDLLEELRRDLPNVKSRHDPETAALQQSMNPDRVLAALDERSEPDTLLEPQEKPKRFLAT